MFGLPYDFFVDSWIIELKRDKFLKFRLVRAQGYEDPNMR